MPFKLFQRKIIFVTHSLFLTLKRRKDAFTLTSNILSHVWGNTIQKYFVKQYFMKSLSTFTSSGQPRVGPKYGLTAALDTRMSRPPHLWFKCKTFIRSDPLLRICRTQYNCLFHLFTVDSNKAVLSDALPTWHT